MKHHHTTTAVLTLALVLTVAAVEAQDTGSADFTRYVALGDSLTAGYTNNSLIYTHQIVSVGALLFNQAGSGSFEQPYVLDPGLPNELFLASLNDPLAILPRPGDIVDWPAWDFDFQDPDSGSFPNFYLGQPFGYQPYDNLGIPGMGAPEAVTTVCEGPFEDTGENPFYCTILRNPECEPVFDDPQSGTCSVPAGGLTALEQALFEDEDLGIPQATFMTVWLGPADVLAAVISGFVIEGETYTPLAEFTSAYREVIQEVTDAGIDLAIANVPDTTITPWVTTIPPFVVDLDTGEPVRDPISGDLIFLLGTTGNGTQRPLTLLDRVILPATVPLSAGIGIPDTIPGGTGQYLGNEFVLDEDELTEIQSQIAAFNLVIEAEAQNAGAAFIDAHALMNEVHANGVPLGGLLFTSDFLTGGLYGYDGLHPTNLGYGIVTQWFVDAINQTYGGSIPPVDLGPLVFNPLPVPPTLGDILRVLFASASQDAMLSAMGAPGIEELEEIRKQRLRDRMSPHRRPHGGRRDVLERRTRER
jgi:lysophospholipase L1-like esterase